MINRLPQRLLKRSLFILAVTAISTAANSALTCRTDNNGHTTCDNGISYSSGKDGVTYGSDGTVYRRDQQGTVTDNKGNSCSTASNNGSTICSNGDYTTVDPYGKRFTRHADGTTTTCSTDSTGVTYCN